MNDIVDLTDTFNDIVSEYLIGEDGEIVVDLDAWATEDLVQLRDLITAALQVRASEYMDRGLALQDSEDEYLEEGYPVYE